MSLRRLWSRWLDLRRTLDRLALPLGLMGLVAVALYNWHQWQRDKELLAEVKDPPPLPPLSEWPELPLVSVLVAAWNEADFIERHIESFLSLGYPHKELVLCAGGSDGTLALAKQHEGARVKVLEQRPGEGKQRALARAFPASRGEVIFLTDADCLLDDDAFERTVYPVARGAERVTTGRFAPVAEQRGNPFVRQQWSVDTFWRERSPAYIEGLIGRNAALARSPLQAAGSFRDAVAIGTDYHLAQKLLDQGERIHYVHHSMIQTGYASSVRAYLRQQSRWLRNILLHGRDFDAREQARAALLQTLSGLAVLGVLLLAPLLGWLALASWLALVLYGTLARMRYLYFGERALGQPRCLQAYLLAPAYFLLDQFMLAYAFFAWLAPGLKWKW